jgi:hypothetical protein
MVNGIPFEDNSISITIDQQLGLISSYSETWDVVDFISSKGVISKIKIPDILLKKNALKLKYINTQQNEEKVKNDGAVRNGDIELVYSTDTDKPLCINAFTGSLIGYFNGDPYTEPGVPTYKDLDSKSFKDIVIQLYTAGLLADGESFRPDAPMLQKDYLYMIGRYKGSYYFSSVAGTMSQKDMDGMYRALINDGIINEEEKEPDGVVTRQEAVKFLLRAAGYRRFAEMKGIFKESYNDSTLIDTDNVGYAAIAKALGFIKGDEFNPGKALTRIEAVSMIYDYLRR